MKEKDQIITTIFFFFQKQLFKPHRKNILFPFHECRYWPVDDCTSSATSILFLFASASPCAGRYLGKRMRWRANFEIFVAKKGYDLFKDLFIMHPGTTCKNWDE